MDLLQGRLAPRPFALGATAVYVAGVATQGLLAGEVTARAGLWPFIGAQALLIAGWLVLHIRRWRDAGQGPAAAIGVAIVYALSVGLLLMLVVFFTNPDALPPGESPTNDAAAGTVLVLLFDILFTPDFGLFMSILKALIVIAFLPAVICLIFSVQTAMRPSA
jgi:uncharacterized membrane protein YhaH (DUF805 family)